MGGGIQYIPLEARHIATSTQNTALRFSINLNKLNGIIYFKSRNLNFLSFPKKFFFVFPKTKTLTPCIPYLNLSESQSNKYAVIMSKEYRYYVSHDYIYLG